MSGTFSAPYLDAIASGMEHRQRRSRMKRERTGKRIELTPRDLAIFELLERYRYLRSTYIHAFVGGASETRFKERLGDLYHEGGYLDRPKEQWQFAKSAYMPVVYENTSAARRVLSERSGDGLSGASNRYGTGANRQFAHTLMICEIVASIEIAATADPNLRFIPWHEIFAKAPAATRNSPHPLRIPCQGTVGADFVVPDALFGLEYRAGEKKSYRFFALEADRATMPVIRANCDQTSYLAKLIAYREVLASEAYRAHLGLPNLLVLTVTTSERHKAGIMSALFDVTGGSTAFLFKSVEGNPPGGMSRAEPSVLLEPWERAGYPPQRISVAGL